MLLREFKDTLQNLKKHKITNEYFANLFGTTSQNISKRIKNDSEITLSELEIIQKDSGIILYAKVDDNNINISENSLDRQNDTTIPEKAHKFGYRLAEIQDKHEYLDKDMAKLLRISEEEYIDIKMGDVQPDINVLNRIKQCFKVSVDWLLYGE